MTVRCSICGRNRPAEQMIRYRIRRNVPSGIGYMFKCPEHNPIDEPFRFSSAYSSRNGDYLKR